MGMKTLQGGRKLSRVEENSRVVKTFQGDEN